MFKSDKNYSEEKRQGLDSDGVEGGGGGGGVRKSAHDAASARGSANVSVRGGANGSARGGANDGGGGKESAGTKEHKDFACRELDRLQVIFDLWNYEFAYQVGE